MMEKNTKKIKKYIKMAKLSNEVASARGGAS